jgi:hypothetical protein
MIEIVSGPLYLMVVVYISLIPMCLTNQAIVLLDIDFLME